MRFRAALTAALVFAALASQVRADYVILQSGQVIRGEITETGDSVSLKVGQATIQFRKSEIAAFGKGSPPAPAKEAALVSSDAGAGAQGAGAALTDADRMEAYRLRIEARKRAEAIFAGLKAPSADDLAAAYRELISLSPFPTVTVASSGLRAKEAEVRVLAAVSLGAAGDSSCAGSLVNSALGDSEASVRKASARAIGSMRDGVALARLCEAAVGARGEAGIGRASEAIRNTGQPMVVEAIMTYASMEIRVARTSESSLSTVPIRVIQTINTSGGGVTVPMTLPIELPTQSIDKVKTTVCLPILEVLREVTGVDHGEDMAAWKGWWQANRGTFEFPR